MDRRAEWAETIPFSRANAARVTGVSVTKLNNWIDRNQLWQIKGGTRFHRSYTIREIFDLAGFAQMRNVGVPEQQCARFVRNFGFYREFLASGDNNQYAQFSWKDDSWQIGVFDPDAILIFSINMRVLGIRLFIGIANQLNTAPGNWPKESFDNFSALYQEAVRLDRLPKGSVPLLEMSEATIK